MQLDYADEKKSERLVVWIGPSLDRDVEQAAREDQRIKSDWIRKVLREAIERELGAKGGAR
jgi:hypothetical protein